MTVLLEQMQWYFAVEEENARRQVSSERVLLTAILAIVAAGLFRFGLSLPVSSRLSLPEALASGCLIASIACLGWAASYLVVGPRSVAHRSRIEHTKGDYSFGLASLLIPFEEDLEGLSEPAPGTSEYVSHVAYFRVLSAAKLLAERNTNREAELFLSKKWLRRGLFLILTAVTIHIFGPWYTQMEVSRHEDPYSSDGGQAARGFTSMEPIVEESEAPTSVSEAREADEPSQENPDG